MLRKPIKILFDVQPLVNRKTGVGYYTEHLIRELAAAYPEQLELTGYYYNFLGRSATPTLPKAPNIRYRAITILPFKAANLLRRLHIGLPIEPLTRIRADFIIYPNFLGLASLQNTPSATVIHDATFIDLPEYVSKRNLHDLQKFVPQQIKRSRFVITVSEFSKQRLCEVYGLQPNQVLVTPIPPAEPMVSDAAEDQQILQSLGVTGKYFLTLGTIEPRKNLPAMIDAFTQLPKKLQREYTFVIAGGMGWNCEREIAVLASAKSAHLNILHVGYVTDEQRAVLLKNASLFTSASFYEGFGMPALEAMSYGIPCTLSDIPIFHETAKDAALYFDQTDAALITTTWRCVLEDGTLQKKLSAASMQRVKQYQWSAVVSKLYDQICKTLEN